MTAHVTSLTQIIEAAFEGMQVATLDRRHEEFHRVVGVERDAEGRVVLHLEGRAPLTIYPDTKFVITQVRWTDELFRQTLTTNFLEKVRL
jgi:hypothetical protein